MKITNLLMAMVFLFSACLSHRTEHKEVGEKSLSLIITSTKTWRWVSIRTEKPVAINHVPSKFGMWFTPDPDFALKPHVVFQDAKGEIFRFVYKMGFRGVPDSGGYFETTISKPEQIGKKNVPGGNGKLDAPVKFLGLDISSRFPVYQKTVALDNLKIDGIVVEDFESSNRWYVADKGGAEKAQIKIVPSPPVIKFVPPEQFQWEVPDNFIHNSDFEVDVNGDGQPDGWSKVTRKNVFKGPDRKPLFSFKDISGIHKWENEGVSSCHSISLNVPEGKWLGWRTTVEKIRPNTTYSITLWYRQPRSQAINIVAFGRIYNLKYMFKEQPEHWVRMSMLVDSGSCAGEGEIAIICKGPGKFWVDHVELYEGTSGIGYERARMELYYYYDVEISPDMISPVSFGYEHLFRPQTAPDYLEFVLDLPPQVEGVGYWVAIPWRDCTDKTTLIKKDIKRNGKPYCRYKVRMPFSARGGYKPFTLPVGYRVHGLIRDGWRSSVGTYSGITSLKWFLKTKETKGQIYGYYFVRWPEKGNRPAGQQTEREFRVNVVRLPEISRPKRFVIAVDVSRQDFRVRPDWVEDFRRIGVTRFGGHVPNDVAFAKKISKEAEKAGFDGLWPWTWLAKDYGKDPSSHGIGKDGKKLGSYCLSYRGLGFEAFIERLKRFVDSGVYQVNLNDEVSWQCFCHCCRAYFKKIFKRIYPNERYIDPIEFEKHPEDFPKHHTVWKDYFGGMYGQAILDVKREVEEYMRSKGVDQNFRFSASSVGLFTTAIKCFPAIEPATKVIEDEMIQPYIYHYTTGYKGNPKRIGDAISASVEASKDIAIKTIPLISPGLGYTNPSCQLDPRSQMKYQILEGAVAGMDGYEVYACNDIDLGDLRYMALANRLIVKYEDIILDGHSVDDITFVNLPLRLKMLRSLRARRLKEQTLIWAADYTTYKSVATSMKIRVPVNKAMVVIDTEIGVEVARLTPKKNIMDLEVKQERGRLLLVHPDKVSDKK